MSDNYPVARGRGQMKITGGPATWREPEWPPMTCAECGKPFDAGERIEAHSPESVWVHETCPDTRRLTRDE